MESGQDHDVTILENIGEFPAHQSARLLRALELRNIRFEIKTATHPLMDHGDADGGEAGDGSVVHIFIRPEDTDLFHAVYQSLFAPSDD